MFTDILVEDGGSEVLKNASKHLQNPLKRELDEEHNNTAQYCNLLPTSEEPKADSSKVILHCTAVNCCPESGTLIPQH
jgi:hypothetical protein